MGSNNGTFHLESPAFRDGQLIPVIHTGEGLNLSPPLRWSGAPAATRSYALLLEDPDSPAGSWVHWLLFNIPAALRALPAGLERAAELPNGARHGSCWGVGRFERIGYQGPLPLRAAPIATCLSWWLWMRSWIFRLAARCLTCERRFAPMPWHGLSSPGSTPVATRQVAP